MPDVRDEEKVARAIYDLMPYDHPLHGRFDKPEWVEGGNSIRQDDARRMARAAIAAHNACRLDRQSAELAELQALLDNPPPPTEKAENT